MANQEEKDLLLSEQNKQQQNALQQMANTQQQLQNVMNNKPANYQSSYTDQINGLYNEIMNRPKFNYSINDDPLYQQYKQQYMSQGKQAMRDTTAQAAALTGGYGNSYGAAAGNQAYQGYLEKLNAAVPELYDRAYTRYQNEGNDMLTRLNAAQTMDNTDYSRWGDQYNQWAAERDAAQSAYDNQLRYSPDYQTSYYNMAMSMLQSGVTPSADILNAAGLTEADAAAILKKLNAGTSGDGQTPDSSEQKKVSNNINAWFAELNAPKDIEQAVTVPVYGLGAGSGKTGEMTVTPKTSGLTGPVNPNMASVLNNGTGTTSMSDFAELYKKMTKGNN